MNENLSGALRRGNDVADEACARVLARIQRRSLQSPHVWTEVLHESIYRERQRLEECAPTRAIQRERAFWLQLRRQLAHADPVAQRRSLQSVLQRYGREIRGHFDPRVYGFATRVLPPALAAILHGGRPSRELFAVEDRVLLEGDIEGLRTAARLGTVVLAPTHFSNLDGLILGYAIYRLGLPPFAYGAGLNLFTNPLTAFFMHNLGAFTIDRRKSDPLYFDLVKEYAGVMLERGQHLLFFPGGTRSRSGAVERRLKLGLLSRVVAAFAARKARNRRAAPIWVVPCTLSYPLVLEASSLIGEYLRREGGPRFVDVRDETAQLKHWLAFLHGLSQLDVRVHVRFGQPLDPFGNAMDPEGTSRDHRGRALDPTRYLLVGDDLSEDPARDAEYTRRTAGALLASYRRDTVALPSSLTAYSLFACLRDRHPDLDLFHLLRVVSPGTTVSRDALAEQLTRTLVAVDELAASRGLVLDENLRKSGVQGIMAEGLRTLSTYHRDPPVLAASDQDVSIMGTELLLYYRNRLEGFEPLERGPS